MKLESQAEKIEIDERVNTIELSCHGVKYMITSSFLGIQITNDHHKGIRIHATDDKNSIVIS